MGAQLQSTAGPASFRKNRNDGYTIREFKSNKKEDASRIMSLILQQMTNSMQKKEYTPLSNMLDIDEAKTGTASDPKDPTLGSKGGDEGEGISEMNPEEAELWGNYGRWRREYWEIWWV
ncbi:hypothetical protein K493DRAFT_364179 [Basidiobolus meristosporus CBS 931.73]|uniref:Uncharacterized protein n=1 Tax=Basidiobolus meristosporus CBS 931.73 TaxID=1314790 RepID=A0A1Y1WPS6_9FUNG|nr:hypothetical protein K493DRAFT_364179 [Basidiobolus meristosporus CBS 931.73]|eukprot:ORX75266.1 hypothetical protein K493DRAFT_364179 [Basidiobolus meristosporus CBS 931.73]